MLLPLRMRCHRLRAGICRAWPASGMIPSLCLTASSKYFRPQLYLRYLSLVSRLLSLYSCLLSSVSCLLYIISCLYIPVSCIMYLVSCLLSQVSCLMSPVSHLLSHVSCLTSPVSCFLSAVVLYCFSAEDAPKISQQTGDWRALLPSPHPLVHPQTTPIPIGGGLWVQQRVEGVGGGEESSSIYCLLRNSP